MSSSSAGSDGPDSLRLVQRLDALERRLEGPVVAEVASVTPSSCGLLMAALHGFWGLAYGSWRLYTAFAVERAFLGRGEYFLTEGVLPIPALGVAGLVVGYVVGLVMAALYNSAAERRGGVRVLVRVGPR